MRCFDISCVCKGNIPRRKPTLKRGIINGAGSARCIAPGIITGAKSRGPTAPNGASDATIPLLIGAAGADPVPSFRGGGKF